jgi:hypothetical protein
VKDTDFCTYASVDNELGKHGISSMDVLRMPLIANPADTDASLYGRNFQTFSRHFSVSCHVRIINVVGEI